MSISSAHLDWKRSSYKNTFEREADPKLPINTSRCLCSACGKYFGGVTAFDAHRVPGTARDRRCMGSAHMDERGFYLSSRGYWSLPHSSKRKDHKRASHLRPVPDENRSCLPSSPTTQPVAKTKIWQILQTDLPEG